MSAAAVQLWAGAFGLSLLVHAAAGWTLVALSPAPGRPHAETRIELRQSPRAEADPVASQAVQAVATTGAVPSSVRTESMRLSDRERQTAAIAPAPPSKAVRAERIAPQPGGVPPRAPDARPPVQPASRQIAAAVTEATPAPSAGASLPAAAVPSAEVAARRAEADAAAARVATASEQLVPRPESDIAATRPTVAAADAVALKERGAALAPAAVPEIPPAAAQGSAAPRVASVEPGPAVARGADTAPIARSPDAAVAAAPGGQRAVAPRRESVIMPPASATPSAVAAAPLRSSGQGAGAPVKAATADPLPQATALAPVSGAATVAALAPQAPVQPAAEESVRDALLRALQAETGRDCFGAFASDLEGLPEVSGFAADPVRLGAFEQRLAALFGAAISLKAHAIAEAQCATLAFVGQQGAQAGPALTVALDQPAIASGTELRGRISGVSRAWLHVLVVDDEGAVHELSDLSRDADGAIRFRAPLTLTNGRVGTDQLLVAIAADQSLTMPAPDAAVSADAFFGQLQAELSARQLAVDLGVAGFRVE